MINKDMIPDVYSTEEQIIGKWVDGKPVYRRCFSGKKNTSDNLTVVYLSNLNINIITNMNLMAKDNNGRWFHEYNWTDVDKMDIYSSGNSLMIRTGSTYPVLPMSYWLVLEYTKTTD